MTTPSYRIAKRVLDVSLVIASAPLTLPLSAAVAVLVKLTSEGPCLHWSQRIGAEEILFAMPKFRTMHAGTPQVATHLLENAASVLTPVGGFLRRASLDELPQLWCVLRGQMSLVGPRPALFNQDDLMALRREAGVAALRPGLTGLAQIKGRDDLSIAEKVAYDARYMIARSMRTDLGILASTVFRVFARNGITH